MKRPLPPPLTRHLVRLRHLAGEQEERPVFEEVEEAVSAARERTRLTGKHHIATPVWRIDHDALDACEPVAWSWSAFPV